MIHLVPRQLGLAESWTEFKRPYDHFEEHCGTMQTLCGVGLEVDPMVLKLGAPPSEMMEPYLGVGLVRPTEIERTDRPAKATCPNCLVTYDRIQHLLVVKGRWGWAYWTAQATEAGYAPDSTDRHDSFFGFNRNSSEWWSGTTVSTARPLSMEDIVRAAAVIERQAQYDRERARQILGSFGVPGEGFLVEQWADVLSAERQARPDAHRTRARAAQSTERARENLLSFQRQQTRSLRGW